jgi:hypothetical protein
MMPLLGVIQLANRPLALPGTLGDPNAYPCDVVYDTAENAWVDRVVKADPKLAEAYVAAARRLVVRGATAVMANCGFAFAYGAAMRAAVDVPVGASPLELLDPLAADLGGRHPIVVLTFDSQHLSVDRLAPIASQATLANITIVGLENTPAFDALRTSEPDVDLDLLRRSVESALAGVDSEHTALVVECSAVCPLTAELRRRWSPPVVDFFSLVESLVGAQ